MSPPYRPQQVAGEQGSTAPHHSQGDRARPPPKSGWQRSLVSPDASYGGPGSRTRIKPTTRGSGSKCQLQAWPWRGCCREVVLPRPCSSPPTPATQDHGGASALVPGSPRGHVLSRGQRRGSQGTMGRGRLPSLEGPGPPLRPADSRSREKALLPGQHLPPPGSTVPWDAAPRDQCQLLRDLLFSGLPADVRLPYGGLNSVLPLTTGDSVCLWRL